MRLVDYKLQSQLENLSELKSQKYVKEYVKSILEDSSRPYFQKADYIGNCLQEIQSKIDYISNDIKQLQEYKKKLTSALNLAKEIVADVLISNGVDRIDGNYISSITVVNESVSSKEDILILDENKVMGLGYVKFTPDIEAIKKALATNEGKEELQDLVTQIKTTTINKAKIRVNSKKHSESTPIVLDLLDDTIANDDTAFENVA
ncbi:siphovirus Gp157 family protein [Aliarcobacter skirrowii]|uniref:siphovirus Gp157 family protein n=1 Tax=Aliarcobacter skirrowii TaxID=28200 RepID=UPI00082F4BF0|nr:siphovirus Gp157 family protein [Aliarcobacter skirrowii]MDX4060706.1 siphovirus Gp157 family protein [Aliarcobacter skirrowii]